MLGFVALMVGSYLMASYAGMLVVAGFILIAMAAAQEVKGQIYPIGLVALHDSSK